MKMRLQTTIEFTQFTEKGESGLMLPKSENQYSTYEYIRAVNIWLLDSNIVEVSVWNTSGWKVAEPSVTLRHDTPEEALQSYIRQVSKWTQISLPE